MAQVLIADVWRVLNSPDNSLRKIMVQCLASISVGGFGGANFTGDLTRDLISRSAG